MVNVAVRVNSHPAQFGRAEAIIDPQSVRTSVQVTGAAGELYANSIGNSTSGKYPLGIFRRPWALFGAAWQKMVTKSLRSNDWERPFQCCTFGRSVTSPYYLSL